MKFLNYGKQSIDQTDIQAVIQVLQSDFLTQGPKLKEFEESLCDYTGAKYCVGVCNGTAALQTAVAALNLPKNCQGITAGNTFIASPNSMLYNQITPIFADIDPKTYLITAETIKKQITPQTKLIMPIHFAGHPCDMQAIKQMLKQNYPQQKIAIIEDAAHAIGSRYADGNRVGRCNHSDLTIFSFHPVKTITCGEGGAITTNNKQLYLNLLKIRNHGIEKTPQLLSKNPGPWYHEMQQIGYNFRLSDLHAALGISQLKKLNNFIQRRRQIVQQYNQAFNNHPALTIPYEEPNTFSAYHLYTLLIDYKKIGKKRKEIMNTLRENNIGTQVHYIPVYQQPYYKTHYNPDPTDYPNTEHYYSQALSIPLYPAMTNQDIQYVIQNILKLTTKTQ